MPFKLFESMYFFIFYVQHTEPDKFWALNMYLYKYILNEMMNDQNSFR